MQLAALHIVPDSQNPTRCEAQFVLKGSMTEILGLVNYLTGPLPQVGAGAAAPPSGPVLAPSVPVGAPPKEQAPSVVAYAGETSAQAAGRVAAEQKANGSAAVYPEPSAPPPVASPAAKAAVDAIPGAADLTPHDRAEVEGFAQHLTETAAKPAKKGRASSKKADAPEESAPAEAAPAEPAPRKVEKINNGEFSILAWEEEPGKYVAQIEVGQDPAISGLTAEATTSMEAMANVAVKAREALAQKKAAAEAVQAAPPPNPDEPVEVPSALVGVTSFGKVVDWFVAPDGGGYRLDQAQEIGDKCVALKAHVPVIGRVGGDIHDRVRRRIAVIEMERAQAT